MKKSTVYCLTIGGNLEESYFTVDKKTKLK